MCSPEKTQRDEASNATQIIVSDDKILGRLLRGVYRNTPIESIRIAIKQSRNVVIATHIIGLETLRGAKIKNNILELRGNELTYAKLLLSDEGGDIFDELCSCNITSIDVKDNVSYIDDLNVTQAGLLYRRSQESDAVQSAFRNQVTSNMSPTKLARKILESEAGRLEGLLTAANRMAGNMQISATGEVIIGTLESLQVRELDAERQAIQRTTDAYVWAGLVSKDYKKHGNGDKTAGYAVTPAGFAVRSLIQELFAELMASAAGL